MTFHLMYRQAKPTSVSEVGAQTKVLTETGEWTVEYNAENRPIRWTQGNKVITMDFDRMGRRVFYKEMEGNRQITHTVFLYDGYLCIQQLFSNSPWNVYREFIWDLTEPLATRPFSITALANVTFCDYGGQTRIKGSEFDLLRQGRGILRTLSTTAKTGSGIGHSATQYIRRR